MDTEDHEVQLAIQKFKAFVANEQVDNLSKKSSRNISTQGSWSNREEEWYFVNKRLLFATQSAHAADTWVMNVNGLLEQTRLRENPTIVQASSKATF